MANDDEHIALLRQGVAAWNTWRDENPDIRPKLSKADLNGADLSGANLSWSDLNGANLSEVNLSGANLRHVALGGGMHLGFYSTSRAILRKANLREADLLKADLEEADLSGASLGRADLYEANLRNANLIGAELNQADFRGANLSGANLYGASLREANLTLANLVEVDFRGADLTGCRIYGISAWGLKLEGATQKNLVMNRADASRMSKNNEILPRFTTNSDEYTKLVEATKSDIQALKKLGLHIPLGLFVANEPEITVDSIEVAQFIYLLLNNDKFRVVIDTITSKAVLILGRFTAERKAVLDALREELRKRDYLPILFDFDVPATRDITETVSLLARMARFIIADLTDPSSIPKELEAIVPGLAVPVQPLLEGSSKSFAMFKDYWKYDWVLPIHRYEGLESLLATLAEKVIAPAEGKVEALKERRRMIEAELIKPQ